MTTRHQWHEFADVLSDWVAGCELEALESEVYMRCGELGVSLMITAHLGDTEVTGEGDNPDPHRAALAAVEEFSRRMASAKEPPAS